MANTKSAERRARQSERRRAYNRSIKSRLHTLKKKFLRLLQEGKKDEAAQAFRQVVSALDKAVKRGVIHKATGNRTKSRLALRLAHAA